jgi:hypothetical protein
MKNFEKSTVVSLTADSILAALPEVGRKFRQFFDGQSFDDFIDPELSAACMSAKIDSAKFERYLAQVCPDYAEDGLDLLEFIGIEYGDEAAIFLKELLW